MGLTQLCGMWSDGCRMEETPTKAYLASPERRQGIGRSFCRTIYRGSDQNFRGDGADVDDAAARRHSTDTDHSLRHVCQAKDVDGELIFELLLLHLQERCVARRRRVVDWNNRLCQLGPTPTENMT